MPMTTSKPAFHMGIDLGGSKISAVMLDQDGAVLNHLRVATPRHNYDATLNAIKTLVTDLERTTSAPTSIGLGIPGSCSPVSGLVRNANSTWLNGRDLKTDLSSRLGRAIRIANDADCFAVSEAKDGAGAGYKTVWGIILGTGCGSGIVIDGKCLSGPLGIAGEWGHNPLPWPHSDDDRDPSHCWCGRTGCMETWVSGPALSKDHKHRTGDELTVAEICALATNGAQAAQATLDRHLSRLARGMAQVINVIDPDVIVIGGGLSQMPHLFHALPQVIAPYIFSDHTDLILRPPKWGDDSGVRGAAWL